MYVDLVLQHETVFNTCCTIIIKLFSHIIIYFHELYRVCQCHATQKELHALVICPLSQGKILNISYKIVFVRWTFSNTSRLFCLVKTFWHKLCIIRWKYNIYIIENTSRPKMFVFGFRTTGRQLTSAAMVSRKGNTRNVASCSDLGFRFPVLNWRLFRGLGEETNPWTFKYCLLWFI